VFGVSNCITVKWCGKHVCVCVKKVDERGCVSLLLRACVFAFVDYFSVACVCIKKLMSVDA